MQKTFALFDFDGTLIRGDSIVRLIAYARRKGLCTLTDVLGALWASVLYGLKLLSAEKSKERSLHFLASKSAAEIDALSRDFCCTELIPRLRREGREAIAAHIAKGDTVLLVSASPQFYLQPLKAELGLTEILATRFAIDEHGGFLGLIAGENCRGVQKPLRLAEYLAATGERLDYDTSAAYGDSAGDLPMLQLCARKVAVNPKRKLRKRLQAVEGVELVRWSEPRA